MFRQKIYMSQKIITSAHLARSEAAPVHTSHPSPPLHSTHEPSAAWRAMDPPPFTVHCSPFTPNTKIFTSELSHGDWGRPKTIHRILGPAAAVVRGLGLDFNPEAQDTKKTTCLNLTCLAAPL